MITCVQIGYGLGDSSTVITFYRGERQKKYESVSFSSIQRVTSYFRHTCSFHYSGLFAGTNFILAQFHRD